MTGRPKRRPADFVKADSGIDADGNWTPVFPGQRPPFPAGNELAVTHGAHVSPIKLGSRPAEIADAVRPYVPAYHPGVEATLQSYAMTLTRMERASAALDAVEEGLPGADSLKRKGEHDLLLSLQSSLRAWVRLSARLASELALTPSASARMMRDVGIGASAAAQHAELLERYRGAA